MRYAAACWTTLILLVSLGTAHGTTRERLLTPVTPRQAPAISHSLRDPGHVQAMRLKRGQLAELRRRSSTIVRGFPLGRERVVDLDLARFSPFAPNARVEVVRDGETSSFPLPDRAYFLGHVSGEPTSRVLVVTTGSSLHGFVESRGQLYRFQPDATGVHVSFAAVDAESLLSPEEFCLTPPGPQGAAPIPSASRLVASAAAPLPILEVQLAIDSDYEFRARFGSTAAALAYAADLVAAANAIYVRDTSLWLRVSYLRLFETSADPWTDDTNATDILFDDHDDDATDHGAGVLTVWTENDYNLYYAAGSPDVVQFLSGKIGPGGRKGVATPPPAVCDKRKSYSVSQVYANEPLTLWDVHVFLHELGHQLGAKHTHCYNPPLDTCANEAGCYQGVTSCSPGTIMSYCYNHPNCNGMASMTFEFGSVISGIIRDVATQATCITPFTPVCGNGILEPGESCDDGNTTTGDGCAGDCRNHCGG